MVSLFWTNFKNIFSNCRKDEEGKASLFGDKCCSPSKRFVVKEPMSNDLVGGPQSRKKLLDDVLRAVREQDLQSLRENRREFIAVPENILKCTDDAGNTLTHLAIHKDIRTLKFVAEELNGDVNAVNNHGKTPLHEAVKNDYSECCVYLLEKGANPEASSLTFSTPFHTAASCGSISCLKVLLQAAPDKKEKVNEKDRNKDTALHKCAYDGGLLVAKWLVENGADVNVIDKHDTTPLLVAAMLGQEQICELLLQNKANIYHKDAKGNGAVHHCASRCLPGILKLLIERAQNENTIALAKYVGEPNKDDNTPLHFAALNMRLDSNAWEEVVTLLVKYGGQQLVDFQNVNGKTASSYVNNRQMKKLFTLEEVRRREEEAHSKAVQAEARMREAEEQRAAVIAEKRAEIEDRIRRQREEQDRLQREVEERFRMEEEAKLHREEEAEQRRREEEEAKKNKSAKKGKKEKK